ncbi:MAG: TolC family protein [Dysgonamonadaceae bacterium]|jgi:outer membrane protein TolC|nr:TolC family protein [Dysgonamonadaceae bacterium]
MKLLKWIKTGIVGAAILISTTAAAQDGTRPLHITLDDAVRIALGDNPTIKVADMEIRRVDYSKKSAWYALIPNVEGTAQYAKYLKPATMSLAGMLIELPTDFNATAGLSASLPLFAPALWHNIKLTTLEMQSAVEKARASRITLRNEVEKAYYNILVAQDSYKTLQDGYALAKQNMETAKKAYDLGLVAAYDYLSAEVQVKNLEPTLLQTENGIEQAKMYLKVLIGIDAVLAIEVTNTLADFEANIVTMGSLDELLLENNSDLRQLDIQKKQLDRSLLLQRSQRIPTFAAFANYTYAGTGNKAGYSFMDPTQWNPATTSWFSQGLIGGFQLNVPITSIFTLSAKEKQLKIQRTALGIQRGYARDGLRVQAVSALNNMNKAVQQVDAAKQSVELSDTAYSIASKRYENGMGTILELQNAALAVTQAKLSYHQAISDYLSSKADLEKLLGVEPTELREIETIN